MKQALRVSGWLLLSVAAAVPASGAAEPAVTANAASEAARTYFPDVILMDQRGKPRRFHSDLLEGKVVVIGSVATNCGETCAQSLVTWTEIEKKLGRRMGSEVRLLSIASDPVRDSAERMRELAKTARAGDGWYFLTGPPAALRLVLAKLDLLPKEDETHAGKWVIANIETGLYKFGPDTMSSEQLLDVVQECLSDR